MLGIKYKRKTRTQDFLLTITNEAKKRKIPKHKIDKWVNSIPNELMDAVNTNKFSSNKRFATLSTKEYKRLSRKDKFLYDLYR